MPRARGPHDPPFHALLPSFHQYSIPPLALAPKFSAVLQYIQVAYQRYLENKLRSHFDFEGVPAIEEALAILVKSYDAMGMTQLRDDAQRVLKASFPNAPQQAGGQPAPTDTTDADAADATKPWWKFW